MDRNHQLDAPNNETLKNIEQLEKRSELSALYFQPKDQRVGELISEEERDSRRTKSLDAITRNIKKRFISIGFLGMLPFSLLAGLVALALFFSALIVKDRNAAVLVVPIMILFLIWVFVTFRLLRFYFSIFYEHALRGSIFLFFQLMIAGAGAHSIFTLVIAPLQLGPITNIIIVSGVGLILSPLVSFILLQVWVSPRISGNIKLSIIALLTVAIGASSLIPLLF